MASSTEGGSPTARAAAASWLALQERASVVGLETDAAQRVVGFLGQPVEAGLTQLMDREKPQREFTRRVEKREHEVLKARI